MPKRVAPTTPGKPRKRGRAAKKADGEDAEHDEDLLHQMRRRAIIDAKDEDEEEWVREMEQEEGGRMLDDIYIPPKITRTEHPFTGERLVIEKIVCENFKSYGGIKEMGPFHKSFSAIIGPNGNGKSNIIDAMLFVFGYRASKIRCKKVSTLIHTSELLPNVRKCAVTVHFVKIIDDGDKEKEGANDFQVVPNSKIAVNRRAFSDNSSRYKLNGKTVKFQEIAKFLKSNGVDLTHNRFLILQGEVEQIALMPPIGSNGNDGLLEFLEDVIGTKRYIRPLAQLEERVEKLDYERDEKLQRVDKAEKEKAALTEPVRKAKDYLRDQNHKMKYQNILCQKQIYSAKLKAVDKEKVKVELEAKIATLQARLDEITSSNQQRREEIKAAEKEFKTSEKEYAKVKKKFDAADAEFIQLNQELQRTNESRKKLLKELSKLEEEIEKFKGIPDNHKRDIEQLTKRKLELDTDIEKETASVAGDLAKLNVKVEEALKMKEVTDRRFAEQKAIRDEKKSMLERLQKQLANFKEKEKVEKKKLEGMEVELEKLKETISKKEKEGRASLSGNNKIAAMEKKLQELGREEGQLQGVEGAKRAEFEVAREEFQTAKDAVEGNNEMDAVDRALLEAKADGTLAGLYGRLRNLAKIPEKYNIAATVSSGMLEYWICDNDTTAGNCINFLRQNNLQFQNFMCLNRLTSYIRQAQERFDTPAQSHRIFDLLEISDRDLAPAYFKAFRNTLVADNIDIATKVSYGGNRRHRVATLKGEIVEVTGSMVGGGRPITSGKFNSKKSGITVTKQQLNNLKKRHDDAVREYKNAQEAREVLTASCRKLSEEIEDAKRKLNNFTSDMAALKAQLPLKEANVQSQRKKLKEVSLSPSVLEGKEAEIVDAETEYEETEEPFQEAEGNSARINQKVEDLQVTKKKEITKKLDKFVDQRKKVEEELNRKIVELKNCETNRKKTEKKLDSVKQEIENLQKAMEKKNERRKKVEADAKEIKESERELSIKLEETKKTFEELSASSHENLKEENSLTKEKLSLENKHADAAGEVKGCANYLKAMEQQKEGLKLHDIPDEEVEELKVYTDDEIKVYSIPELDRKVKKYADKIKSRPVPNLNILDEYREKIETLLERINELESITTQRDQFREAYCRLDQQRSTEFMEGFALISSRLKEMFRMISMGGDAELEVVDTLDLFGCGINFSVRPARKTWKKISNLSGGEKTLASLSLVFALHHFKPSPFYVMDEIDAALDFKNVSIIANYIKDRTKFTQFIIISLRSNMFELADSLLGVYKVDNMSYCIHFGVKKIVEELKRKVDRGRNPAAQPNPLSQGQGQSQPSKQGQQQSLQPPPRPSTTTANSPTPGTSHAARKQLQQQNRKNLDKQNFPGAADLSAIIDDDPADNPDSPSMEEHPTVIEGDGDDTFTPPGRVSDAPSAAAASNSAVRGSPALGGSGDDMFEGMDVDSESPLPKGAKGRGSLPKFTSTPFIGKRGVEPSAPQQRKQGGGFISDSEDVEEIESPPISPIKGSGARAGLVPESPAVSEDSFRTAEDKDNPVGSDDVDEIGPSQ